MTETAQRPGVGREAAGIAAAGHAVLHSVGGLAVTSPVVAHAVSAQHLHSLVPFTAPSALIVRSPYSLLLSSVLCQYVVLWCTVVDLFI